MKTSAALAITRRPLPSELATAISYAKSPTSDKNASRVLVSHVGWEASEIQVRPPPSRLTTPTACSCGGFSWQHVANASSFPSRDQSGSYALESGKRISVRTGPPRAGMRLTLHQP
jgi:hypothetical protein